MKSYICTVFKFLYNEENAEKNIENNIISFENLDSEWVCPNCGVNADLFKPANSLDNLPDDSNNNNINNK